MSDFLTVPQIIGLLNRLKTTAAGLGARQRALDQELARKTALEQNRFDSAAQEEKARAAAAAQDAAGLHEARLHALRQSQTRRAARIERARHSSQSKVSEYVETEEGRKNYRVQKDQWDSDQKRKRDLAENDAAYESSRQRGEELRQALVDLDQSARSAFAPYPGFRRLLDEAADGAVGDRHEREVLEELGASSVRLGDEIKGFRGRAVPLPFRLCPLWLWLFLLVLAMGGWLAARGNYGLDFMSQSTGMAVFAGLVLVLFALYFLGKRKAKPLAARLGSELGRARRLVEACLEQAVWRHEQTGRNIEEEFKNHSGLLDEQWNQAISQAAEERQSWPVVVQEKASRVAARHEQWSQTKVSRLEQAQSEAIQHLKSEAAQNAQRLAQAHEKALARLREAHREQSAALAAEWRQCLDPALASLEQTTVAAALRFPAWSSPQWTSWTPPEELAHAIKFGTIDLNFEAFLGPDLASLGGNLPPPGHPCRSVPLILSYPDQGSILIETPSSQNEAVAGTLNNLVLRLLAQAPPGRLKFTIFDPVRLGQNFAGIMHLADYEEALIDRRIWTQPAEIEQRLAELNEQMEKVIQMYLRNEFPTIADYNRQAGSIAEKYHFLIVADFPANFSDSALRRLQNIAASGARCGVHTLIHWDDRQALPPGPVLDELKRNSVRILGQDAAFKLAGLAGPGVQLVLEPPPPPAQATEFLRAVGLASKDSSRVEVPFEQIAPAAAERWSQTTTGELRVAIGRTGATKLQYLALGKGTRQHALIAGKTGSGKSTLFHVAITNLALWHRPEEVEFYLVDFKKGVEFKCYHTRRLPHARVVAIESDREFGLSVLHKVDEELRRRGDLFRDAGVQDVPGYKRVRPQEPMPRCLLLIDEFQELFVEEDRVAQEAAVLLDRIVRQGRAFGIHVMLGSQTLGGAYTLARTTLGQMVVRIALQCNEADACLIMDENNPAPRLLSRPGEGIYNDMAGALEGNSPFQVVWLSDEERDRRLEDVRVQAGQSGREYPGPFVFEGNAPADVRDNALLAGAARREPAAPPAAPRIWIGAPNQIKGPTEIAFPRQAGKHLLLVGQREDAVLSILSVALVSLAAQHPKGAARFVVLDGALAGSPRRALLERVVRALPHEATLIQAGDLDTVFAGLSAELQRRSDPAEAGQAPALFLVIQGLQQFKKLRPEDDFGFASGAAGEAPSAAAIFQTLLSEGGPLGMHVLASVDTYNNANRFLGRKGLGEFELRVLFQMSANDSAALIDSPKAGMLGLHRALFYNEQEGSLETFRPYATPGLDWIDEMAKGLAGWKGGGNQ